MPSVSLVKKVNVKGVWKFVPIPRSKNSYDTDKVMISGKRVRAPDASVLPPGGGQRASGTARA